MMRVLCIITFSAFLTGCAGYSTHTLYDVNIEVSDFQKQSPVSGASVTIKYDYDSYGWFIFVNTPDDVKGMTNKNGNFSTQIADYKYRILMWVNGMPTGDIDKDIVLTGGTLIAAPKNPKYKIVVTPK